MIAALPDVPTLNRLCGGRGRRTERRAFLACNEFGVDVAVEPKIRAAAKRAGQWLSREGDASIAGRLGGVSKHVVAVSPIYDHRGRQCEASVVWSQRALVWLRTTLLRPPW